MSKELDLEAPEDKLERELCESIAYRAGGAADIIMFEQGELADLLLSQRANARATLSRVRLDVLTRFAEAMRADKHRTCNCPERMLEVLRALP